MSSAYLFSSHDNQPCELEYHGGHAENLCIAVATAPLRHDFSAGHLSRFTVVDGHQGRFASEDRAVTMWPTNLTTTCHSWTYQWMNKMNKSTGVFLQGTEQRLNQRKAPAYIDIEERYTHKSIQLASSFMRAATFLPLKRPSRTSPITGGARER
jgi:hypothetical protein